MGITFILAWVVFGLALGVSLAGALWASRRWGWGEEAEDRVDWDRFMDDLERWSASREPT